MTASGASRPEPVPAEEWRPSVKEALSILVDDRSPEGTAILGTLALNDDVATTFAPLYAQVMYGTTLSARDRDLVILRVATLRDAAALWAHHAALARASGMAPDEVTRMGEPQIDEDWSSEDRILLDAVDELIALGQFGPETKETLTARFDGQERVDLVTTVGVANILAMATKSVAIPQSGP